MLVTLTITPWIQRQTNLGTGFLIGLVYGIPSTKSGLSTLSLPMLCCEAEAGAWEKAGLVVGEYAKLGDTSVVVAMGDKVGGENK